MILRNKTKFLDIFIGLILSIIIILISFNIVLNFKYIYFYDIKNLSIEKNSYLNTEQIKEVYTYLINYISSNSSNFKLPYLPSSKEAIIHFIEVKYIFSCIKKFITISIILLLPIIIMKFKNKNIIFLKYTGMFLLLIPLILALPLIINFDKSFNMFHKILFRNDYWLFDPRKDPIINLLPQEFFFHCSLIILIIIFLSSMICLYIYNLHNRK
ncbi:TIGR01906 family membrane protein [Clostridium oceanicum]|uniref:TIGR01906 family membrane protein n=1 Tax=Clostridium oceanicum TaxID=1543 RepID=A0ABN1J9X5_9CLOT